MFDARTSDGVWVKDAQVYVQGDPGAQGDRSTWKRIAVLEVHPLNVPIQIGWRTETFGAAEFYSLPAQTDHGKFAMEVGDQGVWFVVRPLDGKTQLVIELIELVTRDDPRFPDTPRY